MHLSWEQLDGLPVQTQSGQKLGVIESVEIDSVSHQVVHYQVKPSITLLALFKKSFLVASSQVISLSDTAMIVEDAIASQEPVTNKKQTRLASAMVQSDLEVEG